MKNLFNTTLSGIKWSYSSTFINAVAQIGFNAILARLLAPEVFGLIAMGSVVLKFGQYFSQMGVGQAIIQKKQVSNLEIRAAFTSSALLGSLFFLIFWLLAPIFGTFFNSIEVVQIIQVLSFSFIITGLTTTSLSLLKRELNFKVIAWIEIISYVIAYGLIGVGLAYFEFGIWSLVCAILGQAFITLLLSYLNYSHNLLFTFKWSSYQKLYSYGSKISIISFFEYLGANIDTFIIGRYAGDASLGIYNRAYLLAYLPIEKFNSALSKVLFPAFSKIQHDNDRIAKNLILAMMCSAGIIIPISFGMVAASEELILVLLGDNWIDAIPVFTVLSLVVPFHFLSHFVGIVLEAKNKLYVKLIIQFIYVCIMLIAFIMTIDFGIMYISISLLIVTVLRHVAYMIYISKILKLKISSIANIYRYSIPTAIGVFISIFFMSKGLEYQNYNIVLNLIILIVTGGLILFSSLTIWPQKSIVINLLNKMYPEQNINKVDSIFSIVKKLK